MLLEQQRNIKRQNYIQQDCAGKDGIEYMKEKEEYMNISTILSFLRF